MFMPRLPRSTANLLYAVIALLLLCAPANAQCVGASLPFNYCDKCSFKGSIQVTRNETCSRPLHTIPGGIVVLGQVLVRKPSNGRVGLSAADYAYIPSRNFVGKDSFAFATTFEIDVSVGP